MKKLTKMQQKVYDYIAQFMTKWGYPPSVREICAELNFKSPSTAHFHILNLEKKGYLEHDAGKGRAIRLKGEAQTCLLYTSLVQEHGRAESRFDGTCNRTAHAACAGFSARP